MHHVTGKELGHWRYVHSAISDPRYGSPLSSAIHYYNLGVVQWIYIRPLLLKIQSYETQQRVQITNVASASSVDKDPGVCVFLLVVFVISAFQVGYWIKLV